MSLRQMWLGNEPEEGAKISASPPSLSQPNRANTPEDDPIPAFCRLTPEERKAAWDRKDADKPRETEPMASLAKKPHPADVANLAAIAQAASFSVSLFHGGRHNTFDNVPTLAEARKRGADMEKVSGSSRLSIVYAVLKDGRSFLVPRNYHAPVTPETTMNAKTVKTAPKPATEKKAATERKKKASAKPARTVTSQRENNRYDWKGAEANAAKGKVPTAPDFSAETHTRYRPALAEVEKMAKDKDLAGLKKYKWEGFEGSSVKSILRYRDLCVSALSAKAD